MAIPEMDTGDFELWTLDLELWTLDFGLWTLKLANAFSVIRDLCPLNALSTQHSVLSTQHSVFARQDIFNSAVGN